MLLISDRKLEGRDSHSFLVVPCVEQVGLRSTESGHRSCSRSIRMSALSAGFVVDRVSVCRIWAEHNSSLTEGFAVVHLDCHNDEMCSFASSQ